MQVGLVIRSTLYAFAVAAALLVSAPASARAQDRVYTAAEVGTPASVKNKAAAAAAVDRHFPEAMHRMGGKVQLQFVVKADGSVDAATIKVVVATATALGDAAAKAIRSMDFNPATVDGKPVSSIVLFPLTYAAR